jgi:hypothetical protein
VLLRGIFFTTKETRKKSFAFFLIFSWVASKITRNDAIGQLFPGLHQSENTLLAMTLYWKFFPPTQKQDDQENSPGRPVFIKSGDSGN